MAVSYHFCLSLPETFTQPGRSLLAEPCTVNMGVSTPTVHLPSHHTEIIAVNNLPRIISSRLISLALNWALPKPFWFEAYC